MNIEARLEIAFGADPAADPSGWSWTDVSADLPEQTVSIRRGRADESVDPSPAEASFVLWNLDGDYTPDDRRSPHWPNIRRGTPVRYSIRLDPDDPWDVRFVGQISEWKPEWPDGGATDEATVAITANGILRRLGQGANPLRSVLYRATPRHPTTIAYWSCETPEGPTDPSPVDGVAPMRFVGAVEHAQDDTLAGSSPLPRITAGKAGRGVGRVPPVTPVGGWTAHLLFKAPNLSSFVRVITVRSTTLWISVRVSATQLEVTGQIHAFGGSQGLGDTVTLPRSPAGEWMRVSVWMGQIPPTQLDWSVLVVPAGAPAASALGSAADAPDFGFPVGIGVPTAVSACPTTSAPSEGIAFGHVAVSLGQHAWDPTHDLGLVGETAAERFERLCGEEAIEAQVIGEVAGSSPMGPQPAAPLGELLAECANAEAGILAEMVDRPGLVLHTRDDRYNQAVDVTLDAEQGGIVIPLQPTLDDQRLRNTVVVTRQAGPGGVTAIDEASVAAEGIYDDQVALNLATDQHARDHAHWRLRLGTWPGMRYPLVVGGDAAGPDLAEVVPGDRVRVVGLPDTHPTGGVDVIVEGVTETVTSTTWRFELTGSPAAPWDVGTLDDDPDDPDTDLGRLDSDGSTLASPIDADDTTLSVDVAGPLWTTDAAQFPLPVEIDGEPMTVTSITGTSSPQTFTVVRDTEAPRAHAAGAEVHTTGLVLAL